LTQLNDTNHYPSGVAIVNLRVLRAILTDQKLQKVYDVFRLVKVPLTPPIVFYTICNRKMLAS